MTKDTAEFSQFTDPVACREYTLPRDEDTSEPKGWIRGNTKIGPVLEVTTCCLQGKYGVEIRTKSVNEENSHSWVRISLLFGCGWPKVAHEVLNTRLAALAHTDAKFMLRVSSIHVPDIRGFPNTGTCGHLRNGLDARQQRQVLVRQHTRHVVHKQKQGPTLRSLRFEFGCLSVSHGAQ